MRGCRFSCSSVRVEEGDTVVERVEYRRLDEESRACGQTDPGRMIAVVIVLDDDHNYG
jgi:hypothetical protein